MSAPYHGYDYKILTGQGKDAPGGAYDYMVGGKMIGGFGVQPRFDMEKIGGSMIAIHVLLIAFRP